MTIPNLAPLLNVNFCPVKRFGLGENNAVRATNVRLGPTASEFEIPSAKFHLNLAGEFNVRNALAVVAAAKHCGLSNKQIQSAFDTFKGIKRRMEVRGIAGGVTVIDDFGHHPTAIRETLRALRIEVCQGKDLGRLRTAQQHHAPECLSKRTRRIVRRCRRRGRVAGRATGIARAGGAFESGEADGRLEDCWARTPRICRTWTPSSRTWRPRCKAATSCACSATAASAGFTGSCWSGWGGDSCQTAKGPPLTRRRAGVNLKGVLVGNPNSR